MSSGRSATSGVKKICRSIAYALMFLTLAGQILVNSILHAALICDPTSRESPSLRTIPLNVDQISMQHTLSSVE